MYLEQRAAEDALFAKNYRNPAKNCNKQILNRHFSVKLNHHLIIETTSLYY